MSHCGHQCCEIPSNGYHAHIEPPATCPRCGGTGSTVVSRSRPSSAGPANESAVVGRIVADVVARVAPEIPGLPRDGELAGMVASHALAAYAAGLIDPDVQVLDEREQRTVLAGRVGLALAFPATP
jgi:hypothetical protein